jgi:hypothetical protein
MIEIPNEATCQNCGKTINTLVDDWHSEPVMRELTVGGLSNDPRIGHVLECRMFWHWHCKEKR